MDEDIDWLKKTIRQYEWYVAGERERKKPNLRALFLMEESLDRYKRILGYLTAVSSIG